MVVQIEIRIHAGASSTRRDDDRHRAQAQSYLEFEAAKIVHLTSPSNSCLPLSDPPIPNQPEDHGHRSANRPDEPLPKPHTSTLIDPSLYLDDTQAAITVLESQLVTSSAIVPETVRPKRRFQGGNYTIPSHTAAAADVQNINISGLAESNSSQQTHSSHLESPVLDRSSKRRRTDDAPAEQYAPLADFDPLVPILENSHVALGFVGSDARPRELATGETAAPEQSDSNKTTSELPTSYSLSELSSGSSRVRSNGIHRSVSDPGPTLISEHTNVEEPTEASLANEQPNDDQSGVPNDILTATEPEHVAARVGGAEAEDSDGKANNTLLIIRPPPPTPTIARFRTHITDTLHFLAESPSLTEAYIPVGVTRDLETSERGHWTFSTRSWPDQLRWSFWKYLEALVGSGKAGWGITCSWGAESPDTDTTAVKVFCWGEVVKHIYLLLYVASQSKVRKLGLQWIDSLGEVVVQMRGEYDVSSSKPAK